MASLRDVPRRACSLSPSQPLRLSHAACARRGAATQAAAEAASPALDDLEADSTLGVPQLSPEEKVAFRPWKRAADRQLPLPGSRYQYHPPKFSRGPLHPIQSPASSDPVARDFVPGPFHMPRLKQTWQSTVASDLMALAYHHVPPGAEKAERADRLRGWDGSSPYHKNRPKRAPRGSPVLTLLERDITFRNVPEIKEVTLAAYVPAALRDPEHLVVARSVIMALTGTMPDITLTRSNVAQWKIQEGKRAGIKTTIYGNEAYEFLDRCIHIVFPRIREFKGIKASTGDGSGNLSWGFTPEDVGTFPEVEVNYDMYPSKVRFSLPPLRFTVKMGVTDINP